MLIHNKILFILTIGTLMISVCVPREIDWNYDLMRVASNNRRIVHNAGEEQAVYRGKKHSPPLEKATTAAPDDDEDKKTLAQQVADGKYGLIQTELFASPVKRPGILSYEINPEVPKDNVNNLGGLEPEEIWLAENHLLVLKGGGFRNQEQQNGKSVWPPIDNYIAPQRQVKIPPNPKVPPPFPVQLRDGGPIEFIRGVNGSGGPPPFFDPRFGPPPFGPPPNGQEGNFKGILKPSGNSTEGNGRPPFPYPGPGIGLFPPAVAFLPPPGNFTELDEDDPSIYYPPPYDFVYHKDNSSHVPPGPLVPGIILPPPPNFFAPYEKNKPQQQQQQQHHHKHNQSHRKPPKSRPTQYIQEQVPNKPRPTKPPKPTIIYKISTTPSTTSSTTRIPITTTDAEPNEIQPPRTLPPNTPVGDWVPIPAPRPFYISGLNSIKPTPGNEGLKTKYDLPKNGWVFSNNTELDSIGKKPQLIETLMHHGWDQEYNFNSEKQGRHYTTETPLYTGFKPIYAGQNHISTTPQPETNFAPAYSPVKAPKEYYFYEEPQITEGKYVDPEITSYTTTKQAPKQHYFVYANKHNYEANTLSPPQLLGHVSVKNPSESGRVQPLSINYYEQEFVKPTLRTPPKQPTGDYYYYKDEQKENQGYTYNVPTGPPIKEFRELGSSSGQTKNVTSGKGTSEKPPVYEYSYSAPGYGSIEAPKVGINYGTTPKSVIFETNFTPIKKHQFSFFEYQSTAKPNVFDKEQTTSRPQYYNSGPSYNEESYNLGLYKTPPPYSNVFHQDMGLLDDITKKYFTLFGQKLNNEALNEPLTTPLTPIQNVPKKQYFNGFSSSIQSTTEGSKQNVKFPDEIYEIQNDEQYYSKPKAVSLPGYRQSYPKLNTRPNHGFPSYYRLSSPQYRPYEDYDEGLVRPGHSLNSDIRVNYKNPSPTINPDSEFVDPYYVRPNRQRQRGNSFISYQLPGSGGHFYFLTPQTVKPESYQVLNQGYKYPEVENGGYFKRNTQTKPSRPRRTRPENNSRKPLK